MRGVASTVTWLPGYQAQRSGVRVEQPHQLKRLGRPKGEAGRGPATLSGGREENKTGLFSAALFSYLMVHCYFKNQLCVALNSRDDEIG